MNAEKTSMLILVLLLIAGVTHAATPAGTVITNVAQIDFQSGNGLVSYEVESNPVQTRVSGVSELVITKSGPAQTVAGAIEGFTYTIVVQNTGTIVESGLEIQDMLPPQVDFMSASRGGNFASGQVTWTGIDLAPGASQTVTVNVSTAPDLPAQIITNRSQLVRQEITIPSNPVDTQVLQQLALRKVGIAQKPGNQGQTSQQGGVIDYTITCTNPNPVAIHNVRLIDDIPDFTQVEQISAGGSFNGRQVIWIVGDLAPNASQVVLLSLKVQDDAPLGLITNLVTAVSDELDDTVAQADFGVVEAFAELPNFDFTKRADKAEATVGEEITYTIALENRGSESLLNVVITDALEPVISYIPGSANSSGVYITTTRTVSWGPIQEIAPGVSVELSFLAKVDGPVPVNGSQVENVAMLRSQRILDTPSNIVTTNLIGERLNIELIADPEIILGDGVDTSLLTATVRKASGALADDGTSVTFTTSRGMFPNGGREITDTTLNGTATVRLRSEVIQGSAVQAGIVASTADSISGEITARATVTFAPASILGIVTDWMRNNAPVSGVQVGIAGNIVESTITDANGRYQVPVVQSSTYSIGLSTSDSLGRALALVESVEVQATIGREFSPKNAIVGTVLDATTSQPLPGTTLRLLNGNRTVQDNIQTDSDGRYTILELEPANYHVQVSRALDGFSDSASILVNLNQVGQTMINANLELSRLPSLSFDKIVDKSVAFPGDLLTYTLSYNNAGGEARNITVNDALPVETTFQQASSGATFQNGIVTWDLGTIPAGGAGTLELIVKINSDVTDNTPIQNVATMAQPGSPDPLTASATTVVRQVALSVAKNSDVPQVQPGGEVAYTLAYSNTGGRSATDVTVRETLPSGTTLISATAGANQVGQSLIWEVGVLPPGATQLLDVTLRLSDQFRSARLDNTVTVQCNEIGPVSSSASVDVVFTPILTVEKRANVEQVRTGDDILYTIVYQNAGRLDATGMQVVDRLPDEVEYISGGTYDPATHTITWSIGRLIASSAPQTLNAQVKVLDTASTDRIVNVAEVRSNEGPPVSTQVTVDLLPTIEVTKSVDKTVAKSGEHISYTLRFTNRGGTATNAVLQDPLPSNTIFVSATGQPVVENNTVTWNLGDIDPQVTTTYKLVLEVAAGVPTDTIIENQGSLHSDQMTVTTQVVQTTVENPKLEIEKIAPALVQPGERLTYTLQYRNTGKATATDVVIRDSIPQNTRYVNAPGTDTVEVSGVEAGSSVVWQIGPVPPGESGSVELVVEVAGAPGSAKVQNTASIESKETTPVTASVQTSIDIRTGLILTKEALNTQGQVVESATTGDILIYRFTYQNLGNVAARGIVITDKLPPELEYVDGGSYDAAKHTVTIDVGDLPANSSESSTHFTVRVVENLTPQIHPVENVALIEDDSGESSEARWTVYAMPPFLQVRLVGDRRVIEIGDAVALVIHVDNISTDTDIRNLEIVNVLPAGFEYVPGTSKYNGVTIPDPDIAELEDRKTGLTWKRLDETTLLDLPANARHQLVFRARLVRDPGRTFSVLNTAFARGIIANAVVVGGQVTVSTEPHPVEWRMRVRRPMFVGEGIILGKVFVDQDNDNEQDTNEQGFPNVRLFLEDGRIVITDEFGKYSIPEVEPGIHVIKLDVQSIPGNYVVVRHTTRAAGDPVSQFLDVPSGAVEKADFILQEVFVEQPRVSISTPVTSPEVTQPKLGAMAPPMIPEVEVIQPRRQIQTPIAPAAVLQPQSVQEEPRFVPEIPPTPEPPPEPPPQRISTPVRMPSVIAPLSPPRIAIDFKPARIPAGDPKITVTADQPLTKVVAEHPDGRKIILKKQDNGSWLHEFTVPFESPEGPYPFIIWITDAEGRRWYNFITVTVDNSIPNIYAEFVPKKIKSGGETKLKVTLLIDAKSVSIRLRNGKRLNLHRDKRFHWSTSYIVPENESPGWHNGEITVIAVEGNFKQRAIVAYKVE